MCSRALTEVLSWVPSHLLYGLSGQGCDSFLFLASSDKKESIMEGWFKLLPVFFPSGDTISRSGHRKEKFISENGSWASL